MYCRKCGNYIDKEDSFCPICGMKQDQTREFYQSVPKKRKVNTVSIIGVSLAGGALLFSIFGVGFFFIPIPIAGLVCSIIGLKQCKTNKQEGREIAIVGTVVNSIFIVLDVLVILYIVLFLAIFAVPSLLHNMVMPLSLILM